MLTFWGLLNLGMAQDPLMRMDPDLWLEQYFPEAGIEVLMGDTTAHSARLHVPNVNLFMVRDGERAFAVRQSADLRIVLNQEGRNISKSHNIGFNHGCFTFIHDGDLYQIGGMGFWREHADLIKFHEKTGEWEKIPLAGGPRTLASWNSFYSAAHRKVYIIDGQGGARNRVGNAWLLTDVIYKYL